MANSKALRAKPVGFSGARTYKVVCSQGKKQEKLRSKPHKVLALGIIREVMLVSGTNGEASEE